MAGLHRSGVTLLSSILNQNPRFYSGPLSPVLNLMEKTEEFLSRHEFYRTAPRPQGAHKILSEIIDNYYDGVDEPVIIDKNRKWPAHVNYIESYIKQDAKIICPVRDISEILSSFITLIHKTYDGETFCSFDLNTIQRVGCLTDKERCISILDGVLGNSLNALRFPFENGLQDRILLVEYRDLVLNTEETVAGIYNFLGEEYFNHDFQHIENNNTCIDSYYNLPGLHDVRSKITVTSKDPRDVLPKEIIEHCEGMEFWRN